MKRKLSLLLCAALVLASLAGCKPSASENDSSSSASGDISSGGSSSGDSSQEIPGPSDIPEINFMVLSGPTGVGAAYLVDSYAAGSAPTDAPFTLNTTVVADNNQVTDALVNGSADVAAIATNVAANLYTKSDGAIQVLAVNTLGVLYILEKGDSVHSMADLRGKTIYATGQGANPEYVLDHLLTANGVDPSTLDIQWMTAQEVSAKMVSSEQAICMLPVPAATALMVQDTGVRQALSLSDEWEKLDQGVLPMGCVVARTEFIQENPMLIDALLDLYGDSITFMTEEGNAADGAALVAKYGIAPNEQVAQAAIPQCNLTFLTGQEMRAALEGYYAVLFRTDPASIGGGMPYDAFYYGGGERAAQFHPRLAAPGLLAGGLAACRLVGGASCGGPGERTAPSLPPHRVGRPGRSGRTGFLLGLRGGHLSPGGSGPVRRSGAGRTAGRSHLRQLLVCPAPVPAHPNHPGYPSGLLYPAGPAMDAAGPGTCHHLRPYGSAGYMGEPGPRHRGH